jgi:archaellum component FlaC
MDRDLKEMMDWNVHALKTALDQQSKQIQDLLDKAEQLEETLEDLEEKLKVLE